MVCIGHQRLEASAASETNNVVTKLARKNLVNCAAAAGHRPVFFQVFIWICYFLKIPAYSLFGNQRVVDMLYQYPERSGRWICTRTEVVPVGIERDGKRARRIGDDDVRRRRRRRPVRESKLQLHSRSLSIWMSSFSLWPAFLSLSLSVCLLKLPNKV